MKDGISQYTELAEGGYRLTADQRDIDRGYMLGPDGTEILLSGKHKPGYQYTYGVSKATYAG